ncbi:HD domain-containing protein [Acidianus sp. RZ1]|uniref:HD domain-containing protein n=1 Tax=Acidianus sp. RZ1 TaxID=1540082 RepID=UPI001492B1B0|nr:HD domain-containing protein [Acidianus sp. RZ1]NON61955.1 HD domain-containing protein [Acidianus sp. RZ1]
MKKIFDEVHGYITLGDLETEIVDTAEFQRLRRIKQTSLAYIVYPGATHSRFSHSLGTFFLASKLGEKMRNDGEIPDDEFSSLKIAGLLHDIGQFPFSHALEGYYLSMGIGNKELRDYILENSIIKDILNKYGVNISKIQDLYRGKNLLSSVIDGEVDVDRIDYLIRDSRHTGVQLGKLDLDRLIDTIHYREDGVLAEDKGIISLENFYISRLHMYQAVYYHKTILGFELFLRKIYSKMSESCQGILSSPQAVKDMVNEELLAYWDDNWIISSMYNCLLSDSASSDVIEQIRNFMDRRGPKVVYEEISYRDEQEFLGDIRNKLVRLGIPENSIYPFEEKIAVIDKGKIRILSKGKEKRLKEFSSTLLNEMPDNIIIRRVYVDYEYSKRAREILE